MGIGLNKELDTLVGSGLRANLCFMQRRFIEELLVCLLDKDKSGGEHIFMNLVTPS